MFFKNFHLIYIGLTDSLACRASDKVPAKDSLALPVSQAFAKLTMDATSTQPSLAFQRGYLPDLHLQALTAWILVCSVVKLSLVLDSLNNPAKYLMCRKGHSK